METVPLQGKVNNKFEKDRGKVELLLSFGFEIENCDKLDNKFIRKRC